MICKLCLKEFEHDDAVIDVWHRDEKIPVHRPCLGETVSCAAIGVAAAASITPATARSRIEKRLAFAQKVVERDTKTLEEMDAEGRKPN